MAILAVIIAISLFIILTRTSNVLLADEKTSSEADLDRLTSEVDLVVELDKPLTNSIPLLANEPYTIVVYKESDPELPVDCRGRFRFHAVGE